MISFIMWWLFLIICQGWLFQMISWLFMIIWRFFFNYLLIIGDIWWLFFSPNNTTCKQNSTIISNKKRSKVKIQLCWPLQKKWLELGNSQNIFCIWSYSYLKMDVITSQNQPMNSELKSSKYVKSASKADKNLDSLFADITTCHCIFVAIT